MIKKRIESLIERDYLERIEEAPVPSYRYLA
jgi:cullin 3